MTPGAAHPPADQVELRDTVLSVRGVRKAYGPSGNHVLALEGISLAARRGEFLCLVGASGCGKSTLLNLITELDRPTGGEIMVDGRASLLFQEAALFPWLTAAGNIELPLRIARTPGDERRRESKGLAFT